MAYPSYIDAFNTKELHRKVLRARQMLEKCLICPRRCGVNRLEGQLGYCRTGTNAILCSYFAHHGEEPAISGQLGSGTLFFSRCNMKCVYCQNYDFSQLDEGREVTPQKLASYMLELQKEGCHNINLVTPTHVLPEILEALLLAAGSGLRVPIVYNTSGYELPEMINFLDGIIDIYLPDMRYASETESITYSNAPGYPGFNQSSVKEMFRQVGVCVFDEHEIVKRGLIIRHLVLPQNLAGTQEIFSFIVNQLSPQVYVSLLSQYFPAHKAGDAPGLDRRISLEEYEAACKLMEKYGLENGWIQESGGLKRFAGTNIKRNV